MTKRTLVLLVLYCVSGSIAFGQNQSFWNCGPQSKTNHANLICLVPVATQSVSGNTLAPAINSAFATELSQLPILSSGPAIAVTYDAMTGVPIVSDSLGPILTDRAETVGKHKLLLAFGYQRFRFNAIDGTNLDAVPFVFSGSSGTNAPTQYTVENENVSFKLDQYVGVATFGLTKKIDVSVIVPFNRVSIGTASLVSLYTVGPDNSPQGNVPPYYAPYVHGSASGFGDILANIKGVVLSGEKSTIAAGMLFRFPTGDALNYLGSGAYGFNPYGVWSYGAGKLSPHVRLGYQFNTSTLLIPSDLVHGLGSSTLPGGLQYNLGADYIFLNGKRPATLAIDVLGNYIVNSPWLASGYAPLAAPGFSVSPYPYPPFEQTVKYQVRSYNSDQIALGVKFKPWESLIVSANVTFQVNNVGLRSSPVPLVGLSYTFKP